MTAPETTGGTIARRAGIVASGTLASRLLGAVRDATVAAVFALGATDAFWLAFTIPNALRVLLGEGAVSAAFVPVLTEVKETQGMERARAVLARMAGAMFVLLLIVSVTGVVLAPWIVKAYAWGFQANQELFELTITLTRLVFPYILLVGLGALAMGALNTMKRFAAPAYAPALLNVSLIAAALLLAPVIQERGLPAILALGVGALVGGVLQVAAQLPSLRRVGLLVRPRIDFGDPYVRKSFRLLVPLLAGLGVYQLNILLSRLFASFLPTGSVSYLYYGQRLAEIPQGMFALAIASAALPSLSQAVASGNQQEAKETFRYALKLSLFVAVPATVALIVLAEPAITVFFGRGKFDAHALHETTRSFVWQAAGIWAVASVRTVVPMFHAYNDTRTPVIASAVNLAVFVGLSLALMGPMQHAGLAVAMSTAAVAQMAVLLLLLRKKAGRLGLREVAQSLIRIAIASASMSAVAWGIVRSVDWSRGGNNPENIAAFLGTVVAGAATYLCVAALLKSPELSSVRQALRFRR